jgi:alkylation response protein AidB-like acyl-CoA dehydrogenase
MTQLIADRRDVDFVLFEQLKAQDLCQNDRFRDFNEKTMGMVVNEARKLAINEILPTFSEGDRIGLDFDKGIVKVPKCFHRAFKLFKEGDWVALTPADEYGGQGMPAVLAQAVTEYLLGANYAFTLYAWSGFGAAEMLEHYGSRKLKDMFLEKMYSGQWGGTMAMTEPEAGSDVGNLATTAVKNPDGTYSITGNKVFITCAEHDLTENIVHMLLARIEGAPAGTKGISLFIVPKIWVNEDGSLGGPNDVVCTGIEKKMGIHASATCSMAFGSKGNCRGLLLGEAHKGMQVMFRMMNLARLAVGAIGFTSASTAYIYALNYARERLQGKDLEKMADADAPQVAIINHPDVRRMLMWMKTHVEGMRSFMSYVALCVDKQNCSENEKEKEFYKDMLDLLTPVIKSYCTDKGFEVCSQSVQVFGGYGYTKEYPVEQLMRDVRVASIYEGTNGIQAMDFLGRKLGMKNGAVFMSFISQIQGVISEAKGIPTLSNLALKLDQTVNSLAELAMFMGKTALSPEIKKAFANASPFLDITGDVIMGWMLLWRAVAAIGKLNGDQKSQASSETKKNAYYHGQIKSAEYYILNILPVTRGKIRAVIDGSGAMVDISDLAFGAH